MLHMAARTHQVRLRIKEEKKKIFFLNISHYYYVLFSTMAFVIIINRWPFTKMRIYLCCVAVRRCTIVHVSRVRRRWHKGVWNCKRARARAPTINSSKFIRFQLIAYLRQLRVNLFYIFSRGLHKTIQCFISILFINHFFCSIHLFILRIAILYLLYEDASGDKLVSLREYDE